jgi:predicted NBD/HSP70 family sugar kinase
VRKGTNLPAVGSFNQTVVLDAIRRSRDGISRIELTEATGLASQTVSNVCRRLIEDGWVSEVGKRIEGPGKPRVMLELSPRGAFAVGVHLDPAIISFVVTDLSGRVVASVRKRTPTRPDPEAVIQEIVESVDELLSAPGIVRSKVLGIGIASPGPVDPRRGIVLDPPLLEGWRDVPLRDALAEATGLPVVLEKDVTSAVVAELWLRTTELPDNFAFFYFGSGIAIGLALAGEAYRGDSGNAGDGGTLYVPTAGLADGRAADMIGYLATPGYIVAEAAAQGLRDPLPSPHDPAAVEEAFDALLRRADEGDAAVRGILDRAADYIGVAVTSVVNLLDVSEIFVGGPYWQKVAWRFQPRIAALVNSSRDRVTHHPVRFREATVGDDTAAVGGACLVFDAVLSPRPSSLLIAP